jgi:hypothetical protein
MELSNGDYVSKLWLNEGPGVAWTVVVIQRKLTSNWEIGITSDPIPEPGATIKCKTPLNYIILPSKFSENLVNAYIESIVSDYEKIGKCRIVATVEVHSADPQVFIDKFYEVAQQNDKISCSFYCKEMLSPSI